MSTGWKVLIILMLIVMVVGGYLGYQRLNDADARLGRLREMHVWLNQDFFPGYARTHRRVWDSSGDPDPPPVPRDPPGFD